MASTATVLVIEDDPEIQALVTMTLATASIECRQVARGEDALKVLQDRSADLVLMDLGLPGMSGLELITRIDTESTPVIVMTVRNQVADKVRLFENGAVDYIVKPFDPMELLVRVRSALRRNGVRRVGHERLSIGPVTIDQSSRTVALRDEVIDLTPREFDLLLHFAVNRGIALTRESILEHVWGYDADVSTRTVDIHVGRIRTKVPGLQITTLHRTGYRLEEE
jgi:DNA-binding response OmpR family regulator